MSISHRLEDMQLTFFPISYHWVKALPRFLISFTNGHSVYCK